MQVCGLWRFNWCFHLWVLLLLLLCSFRYEWLHADIIFLWLHGLHLLWFFPHAWNCWVPSLSFVCSTHLSVYQMRMRMFSKELSTILTKHQGALTWSQRSHYTLMCTIVVLLREDGISISESWKDSIGDNYRGNWSCPTMVDRYRSRVFLFPSCGATFELCGARLGISNSFIQLQAFYQGDSNRWNSVIRLVELGRWLIHALVYSFLVTEASSIRNLFIVRILDQHVSIWVIQFLEIPSERSTSKLAFMWFKLALERILYTFQEHILSELDEIWQGIFLCATVKELRRFVLVLLEHRLWALGEIHCEPS